MSNSDSTSTIFGTKSRSSIFIDEVSDSLFCAICLDILLSPVACKEGHACCKVCLLKWFQRNPDNLCSTCNQPMDPNDLIKVRPIENIISECRVRCVYGSVNAAAAEYKLLCDIFGDDEDGSSCVEEILHERGRADVCAWTGVFLDLERHVGVDCEYAPIKCANRGCPISIKRRDLAVHSTNCKFRRIRCFYCKVFVTLQDRKGHLSICSNFLIKCKCGKMLMRKKQKSHDRSHCPLVEVPCSFAMYGCDVKLPRGEIKEHHAIACAIHLDLVQKHTLRLQTRLSTLEKGRINRGFRCLLSVESINTNDYTYGNIVEIFPDLSIVLGAKIVLNNVTLLSRVQVYVT